MKVAEVGKQKLAQKSLPTDLNVVRSGGYDNISKLAADPKAELVTLIVNNLRKTGGTGDYDEEGKIDALIALLQSEGKGFSSVTVDGEWNEVLARQGKKSTKSQRFVGKRRKAIAALSNFNVKAMKFENLASTSRGNGVLKAVVKVCNCRDEDVISVCSPPTTNSYFGFSSIVVISVQPCCKGI